MMLCASQEPSISDLFLEKRTKSRVHQSWKKGVKMSKSNNGLFAWRQTVSTFSVRCMVPIASPDVISLFGSTPPWRLTSAAAFRWPSIYMSENKAQQPAGACIDLPNVQTRNINFPYTPLLQCSGLAHRMSQVTRRSAVEALQQL
jgi:hypothetical protein